MNTYKVAVIAGDGIGPEVINEGIKVLNAVAEIDGGFAFDFTHYPWGCEYYRETGRMMAENGMEQLAKADAIFLGAVGAPGVPDHISLWDLLLTIRKGFDQYVNLRPVKLLRGAPCPLKDAKAEDIDRSMRRARAKVRRLALANDFRWFVTLTLDPQKVNSKEPADVVRKLNAWCSNMVQRNGLRYILVPEYHKKGGIHFHGFFSDSLQAVDSGTIKPPQGGKPRRPRSAAQRAEWLQNGGQIVYNLPGWTLGFTTAMELYGEYPAAVAYVCKYIGKEGEKPAGRWYYSGGNLVEASVEYVDISPAELAADYGTRAMVIYPPGKQIAIVNGIKVLEQVQEQEELCQSSNTEKQRKS